MASFPTTRFLANIRLKYVVIITLLLALILFLIALFGIQKSKSNMLMVMEKEGIALLESLILASQNAVRANALVEELVGERLRDIADLVNQMEKDGRVNNSKLESLVKKGNLSRIDIMDHQMNLKYSSNPLDKDIYEDSTTSVIPSVTSILEGEEEEVAFGIEARTLLAEKNYAVAVKRSKEAGAVVVVASASYLESFKKEIGIGYLIQKISQQSGIDYIVLQSMEGIVLASKKVERMLKIEEDPFIQIALTEGIAKSRITSFEAEDVLEVVKLFKSEEIPSGIFRIGLSLKGYKKVASGYQKQMILFSIILFILGLLTIGIVIINQNYSILDRSYKEIKTLTGNVLEAMHSAVMAVDEEGKIVTLNRLAEDLFGVSRDHAIGQDYDSIFPDDSCLLKQTMERKRTTRDVETEFRTLSGEDKVLIIGTSCLFDEEKKFKGAVAVIHDITELKKYEEEAKRAERLSALGDMAAGVAHEIRNPLNAISITAQRLKSEFVPQKDQEEYTSFTRIILDEIKRLDNIINQFLSLAKAQKLNLVPTDMGKFLNEVADLTEIEAKEKDIHLNREIDKLPEIKIDPGELKKALLNIMLNGIQAMPSSGTLGIRSYLNNLQRNIIIEVKDSGGGIPKEKLSKIFQPYFSTKEKGTGLGLSIAYRIISDHKGKIEVKSEVGKGTIFTIKLPIT
ncbi:MAG: PAS domain S-box protein [candidate division Zixibacteria bacterium]|nr:PAS domain S-box protein [candidate division Zixibacteria bacterium]